MTSVTGIEADSAFLKSSPIVSSSALPADASPNSSMVSAGCAFCAAATAASTGSTLSTASSNSPVSSNWTSAERPSLDSCAGLSSGERTLVTTLTVCTRLTTSATAALNAASLLEPPCGAWISMHLARRRVEAGLVQHLGGLARLALSRCRRPHLLRPGRLAQHEGDGDEREPADHGELAVPGAPAAHAGGQVARFPKTSPAVIPQSLFAAS